MNVVFRGASLDVQPQAVAEKRIAVAQENSPELVALVLGALHGGSEIVLQNARLTAAERAAQLRSIEATVPAGEPATILFTSGTTGAPKAARLVLANHLASARAAIEILGIEKNSRFLCAMPMFHAGGLAIVLRCELAGATLLLHERFDAQAVARELHDGNATHVSLVASTLARVLDVCADFPPSVQAVLVGGGPVSPALLEKARRAGLPVLQTYGLTETASMATCERPGDADGTTAGPPIPGMELRIGAEIELRGPAVMRGYLGAPPVDGWFATGDLGELDGRGRLIVHARRTDLIVSGGENVYPAEVEAALLAHPLVREATVLPAADARWGQVGVAYVSTDAAESDLRAFLRERIAKFKVPARFVVVPALPRTAAGKVDRARLQEG